MNLNQDNSINGGKYSSWLVKLMEIIQGVAFLCLLIQFKNNNTMDLFT